MLNQIIQIQNEAILAIENAISQETLGELQGELFGKKGKLKQILSGVKDLSPEEKQTIGKKANEVRNILITMIEKKAEELKTKAYKEKLSTETIDVSLEYKIEDQGYKHPITHTSELLEDIFFSLGFEIATGNHIETEKYNFDMLNIPDNHPARDVWDTFWLADIYNQDRAEGDKYLLRTHTSPVQIHSMLKANPDETIKIIVPGRVFRYEQEDARHTSNFYQLEGLVVGKNITFGSLKAMLDTAMKQLLGEDTKTRFRPSIFPFTEPSAEVDVSCQICNGTGMKGNHKCSMCSGTGWVELLGSGMVHPKVLRNCGIDPEIYTGFAFGMGIDRIAAQRFGISSSRMFYQNKTKLNEQF